jgi:hypothetical protein
MTTQATPAIETLFRKSSWGNEVCNALGYEPILNMMSRAKTTVDEAYSNPLVSVQHEVRSGNGKTVNVYLLKVDGKFLAATSPENPNVSKAPISVILKSLGL